MPLWTKNGTETDDWMIRFTVGDDYRWDRHLLPYDVRATEAHAWGLAEIGVLSDNELADVRDGLEALVEAVDEESVTVEPEDEDAHTVIERFLTDACGAVGKKVHAGRSRNDQVLAALRLWLQDALAGIGNEVAGCIRALCDLAETHDGVLLPGYTHLQRAMPSTVPLWALGYAESWLDDLETLRHVRRQVNVSPLGSAAGYGVPVLDLPRQAVADRLGFRDVQAHATSVQLSRGKHELAVAHACVQTAATANRLAADLVLFLTSEFDFATLPDALTTGSSIMPQKKNPDLLELVRGHYHRLAGKMQTLATLPANLPGGYHRDLQLTKAAVMECVQGTGDVLRALQGALDGVTFNAETTQRACTPELLATQQALEQVAGGVPFRDAYRSAADPETHAEAVDGDAVLDAYVTPGSPGNEDPDRVRRRLAEHDWIG